MSCSQEQLHRAAVIVHFQAENRPGLGKESRPVCVFGAKERIEQCDLMQKEFGGRIRDLRKKEGDYTGTVEYNAER